MHSECLNAVNHRELSVVKLDGLQIVFSAVGSSTMCNI